MRYCIKVETKETYTYDGGINLLKDYINDDTWEDDNGDLA